jgi:hypothetical protein
VTQTLGLTEIIAINERMIEGITVNLIKYGKRFDDVLFVMLLLLLVYVTRSIFI